MKKNLIMTAAIGFQVSQLRFFIKSLRTFENCRVILIFEHTLDQQLKDKFKNYKIEH